MAFWDDWFGGNSVDSLVRQTEGFLTKFRTLQSKIEAQLKVVADSVAKEDTKHNDKLESLEAVYASGVDKEGTRHSGVAKGYANDEAKLQGSLRVAKKVVSFFDE